MAISLEGNQKFSTNLVNFCRGPVWGNLGGKKGGVWPLGGAIIIAVYMVGTVRGISEILKMWWKADFQSWLCFITHYVSGGKDLSNCTFLQYFSIILGYLYCAWVELNTCTQLHFLEEKLFTPCILYHSLQIPTLSFSLLQPMPGCYRSTQSAPEHFFVAFCSHFS